MGHEGSSGDPWALTDLFFLMRSLLARRPHAVSLWGHLTLVQAEGPRDIGGPFPNPGVMVKGHVLTCASSSLQGLLRPHRHHESQLHSRPAARDCQAAHVPLAGPATPGLEL